MRQRTSYPKLFKAQVVQECLLPDASIASVALRHRINTNLVRKWIPVFRDQLPSTLPAFVPLKLETSSVPVQQALANIEIAFGKKTLMVSWPTSDPDGCARFVRGLTQ